MVNKTIATAHMIITSIEFGSSGIRGIVVKTDATGRSSLLGCARQGSAGLSRGGITDMNAAVDDLRRIKLDLESKAGTAIGSVTIGISGAKMNSVVSTGVVAVMGREISWTDISRAAACAASMSITAESRPVFASIRKFTVDGQEEVLNPVGMPGTRLDVELLLVTGSVFALDCIDKACTRAGITIDRIVPSVFASAREILQPEEVRQGALLVDLEEGIAGLTAWSASDPAYVEILPQGMGDDVSALITLICERLDLAGVVKHLDRVVIADRGTDITALRDGLSAAIGKPVRVGMTTHPFAVQAEPYVAALIPLFLMSQAEGLSIPIQENQERRSFEVFKRLFRSKEQNTPKSFTVMMPLHR